MYFEFLLSARFTRTMPKHHRTSRTLCRMRFAPGRLCGCEIAIQSFKRNLFMKCDGDDWHIAPMLRGSRWFAVANDKGTINRSNPAGIRRAA
jgi:hypothetical protein